MAIVREKSDNLFQSFSNRDIYFSSFGFNNFTQAVTVTDVIPLSRFYYAGPAEHLPVSWCSSQVVSIPEESASIFCLKFVTPESELISLV